MGRCDPAEAEAKIEEQRAAHFTAEPKNLEEQAINLVGTDIYEKLVKHYTEKQWGRPCTELPAFIIKRLPVRLILITTTSMRCIRVFPTAATPRWWPTCCRVWKFAWV